SHPSSMLTLSNQVLPFPSTQSTFFWTRFCRPYGSMMHTSNYTLEAQTKLLTYFYARVNGIMGAEEKPETLSLMTIDGSPCEVSWASRCLQRLSSRAHSENHASISSDPRTGKYLRGSQVLDWLATADGGLGVIVVKDGWENWRRECEKFFLSQDDGPQEYNPPWTAFFIGFTLVPSGHIKLKAYYMPTVRTEDPAVQLVKSPIHILDKDFSPLVKLMGALHPSLVDQAQMMLEYFDSVEERLRPAFHFVGVDEAPAEKNRFKIYFQTRVGLSFNDVRRNFTLGGRLDTSDLQKNVARLEMLWNLIFPSTPSSSGLDPEPLTDHDVVQYSQDSVEHPVNFFIWYYEFAVNSPSLVPKVYWQTRHYCLNDLKIFQAMQDFYDHPTVNVHGPLDGEHGPGWVIREAEKAFTHRSLTEKPGITTWVTFGHKHKGYEMMTYFSPEVWAEHQVDSPPVSRR
ncbi:tryptophan dimethylallyltransferase-domain-containing protein, partial [Pterulicium gracile]